MNRLKRLIPTLLVGLLLLAGLAVLFYPSLSSWYNQRFQMQAVVGYNALAEQASGEEAERELARAAAYNQALTGRGLYDPFIPGGSADLPADYTDILNLGDGVMGTLRIPKIDVNLPIYHGTGAEALQKGAGHMEGTAFPVGGAGNHAVITGHTALPSATLFSDLRELALGDTFYIRTLGDTLAYQVDDITVVEPTDTKRLKPVPGEDYVTLVTCTPYAVNSHRLLVRGRRVPCAQPEKEQSPGAPGAKLPLEFIIALAVLALVIAVIIVLVWRRKNQSDGRRVYKGGGHDKFPT